MRRGEYLNGAGRVRTGAVVMTELGGITAALTVPE
jgi:hypothetical protein